MGARSPSNQSSSRLVDRLRASSGPSARVPVRLRSRPTTSTTLFRKLEDPDRGTLLGRSLDVRDKRVVAARLQPTGTYHDSDVFLSVRRVADRRRARHVVQTSLPELGAGLAVVGADHPIQ